jgi:hypothetical protein
MGQAAAPVPKLAAHYHLPPPEMRFQYFQFVKCVFDLRPFVLQRGQFFGLRLERIQHAVLGMPWS